MGLPYALTSFTSPIVETALKTGGRGETTTLTDYGVIGDAFFKKAQLDLGIAELKGNMAMDAAKLKSSVDMERARLNTDMLKARMDYDLNLRQMKSELEANESSVFESVMTGLTGAAMAASIPLTMGASTPVVVGAAAGGGLLAGMASAKGGRRAGEASLQMLNSASVLATSFKSSQAEKVGKESLNTVLTEGAKWANILNNPAASPQARSDAQQQLNQLMANQYNAQIQKGVNPEIAFKGIQGMGQMLTGSAGGGSSSTGGAVSAGDAWEMRNQALFNKAMADPRFNDAKTAGQAGQELSDELKANYASSFGRPGSEPPMIPGPMLDALIRRSGITQKPGLMAMNPPQPMGPEVAEDGGPVTSNAPAQGRRRSASRQPQGTAGGTLMNPQEGNPIQQHAPSFTNPVVTPQAKPAGPMIRKGVEMQDGMPMAAQREMELAEQGAKAVAALKSEKDAMPDNRSKWDKFNDATSLGIFKESDYKNRQQELDEEIKTKEAEASAHNRKAQEIQGRAVKIDPEKKAKILAPLPGKTTAENNFNTATEPAGELFAMLEEGELPSGPENAAAYKVYKEGITVGGQISGVKLPTIHGSLPGETGEKESLDGKIVKKLTNTPGFKGNPEEVVASFRKAEQLVEQIATEAIPIRQKGSKNPITIEELKKEISSILFSGAKPKQIANELETYMKGLRRSAATPEGKDDSDKRKLEMSNLRLEGQNKVLEGATKRLTISDKIREQEETKPSEWEMIFQRRAGGR